MRTASKIAGAAAAAAMLLVASAAFAQTTTDATTTPGVPDTGAGGDVAANVALMTLSAATALGAAVYLSRKGVFAR